MLDVCGAKSIMDLYADVPEQLRLNRDYDLPKAQDEQKVRRQFAALSTSNLACFAGAGAYAHFCPAVIDSIVSRSEYLTSYTPYQSEISQGTLQYIFEYQSMLAQLTAMDICNASMYDGATATAEAMIMAVNATRKRRRALISATLNPDVIEVMRTYARYHSIDIDIIPEANGVTDLSSLDQLLQKGDVAAVVLPQPNYYGIIEDLSGVADKVHEAKALLVINAPASPLAVIRPAGEWGADIAVGDAQSLGMPLSVGGPYLGYMCCTKALMRKIPGRIVGATTDKKGQRTFVLTLQAREQHIRREKATSNICSNQGVMTLSVPLSTSRSSDTKACDKSTLSAPTKHTALPTPFAPQVKHTSLSRINHSSTNLPSTSMASPLNNSSMLSSTRTFSPASLSPKIVFLSLQPNVAPKKISTLMYQPFQTSKP